MVSCVTYNFLNHENFVACILKIHVTVAKVPCTFVHIFFKEASVVCMLSMELGGIFIANTKCLCACCQLKQQNSTQQQLLEHLLNERAANESIAVLSSDSSTNSSRSTSPTET